MPKDRHTAAFVAGALIGGLAGAAITLWRTPRSGADVRAEVTRQWNRLTGNTHHEQPSPAAASVDGSERLSSRALEFVERATAPLVGVKLGQTANNGGATPIVEEAPESPVAEPPAPAASGTEAPAAEAASQTEPTGQPTHIEHNRLVIRQPAAPAAPASRSGSDTA